MRVELGHNGFPYVSQESIRNLHGSQCGSIRVEPGQYDFNSLWTRIEIWPCVTSLSRFFGLQDKIKLQAVKNCILILHCNTWFLADSVFIFSLFSMLNYYLLVCIVFEMCEFSICYPCFLSHCFSSLTYIGRAPAKR